MGIAKVDFMRQEYLDLTNDTVTPETLQMGYTAHAANGSAIVGTGVMTDLSNDTVTPETLLNGYTAHAANGSAIVGIATSGKYNTPITVEINTATGYNS